MWNVIYNKFYGGIAEDSFMDDGTQVANATSCSFNETKWVNSNNAYTTAVSTPWVSIKDFINTYVWTNQTRNVLAYGSGGKIYNCETNISCTLNSPTYWIQNILWAIQIGEYVYFFISQTNGQNIKLQKVSIATLNSFTDGQTLSPTEITLTTIYDGTYWTIPVLYPINNSEFYIWYGKNLIYILVSSWWSITEKDFSVTTWTITWLTNNSWYLKVFCDIWDVIYWDKINSAESDRRNLWVGIKSVVLKSWIDYIITTNNKFGYLNGYIFTPLNLTKSFISIWIFNNKLALSDWTNIYSFGKNKSALNDCLQSEVYNASLSIWAFLEDENNVLYFYSWNVIYKYIPWNGTQSATLSLRKYTWWSSTILKQIRELRIYWFGTISLTINIDWTDKVVFSNKIISWRYVEYSFTEQFFELQPKLTFTGRFDELQIIHDDNEQW